MALGKPCALNPKPSDEARLLSMRRRFRSVVGLPVHSALRVTLITLI